jgi:hypothetical protein
MPIAELVEGCREGELLAVAVALLLAPVNADPLLEKKY